MTRRRTGGLPARATGVVGGGAVLGASVLAGAPWWVLLVTLALGTLPSVLPQESEHRRDVFRDLLRHRERMVRIKREPPPDQLTTRRNDE